MPLNYIARMQIQESASFNNCGYCPSSQHPIHNLVRTTPQYSAGLVAIDLTSYSANIRQCLRTRTPVYCTSSIPSVGRRAAALQHGLIVDIGSATSADERARNVLSSSVAVRKLYKHRSRLLTLTALTPQNIIFTALHEMQTRSSDENSVRPSIFLSNP